MAKRFRVASLAAIFKLALLASFAWLKLSRIDVFVVSKRHSWHFLTLLHDFLKKSFCMISSGAHLESHPALAIKFTETTWALQLFNLLYECRVWKLAILPLIIDGNWWTTWSIIVLQVCFLYVPWLVRMLRSNRLLVRETALFSCEHNVTLDSHRNSVSCRPDVTR